MPDKCVGPRDCRPTEEDRFAPGDLFYCRQAYDHFILIIAVDDKNLVSCMHFPPIEVYDLQRLTAEDLRNAGWKRIERA